MLTEHLDPPMPEAPSSDFFLKRALTLTPTKAGVAMRSCDLGRTLGGGCSGEGGGSRKSSVREKVRETMKGLECEDKEYNQI